MKIQIEKCPFCPKQFKEDSEEFYWHLKIHKAKEEAVSQDNIEIKPNTGKYSMRFPDDPLNKII